MFRVFGAIGRVFRAFMSLLVGNIDGFRRSFQSQSSVISAEYDDIVNEKRKRFHDMKSAVDSWTANNERKRMLYEQRNQEVAKYLRLKQGAAQKCRELAANFASPEDAKKDAEFVKHSAAFADFSSTLAEKEKSCADLHSDITKGDEQLKSYKTQLVKLLREMEKLKDEKHDTILSVTLAKETAAAADLITNISEDKTSARLEELRNTTMQMKAKMKSSQELAGLSHAKEEEEYLRSGAAHEASGELDALLGWAKEPSREHREQPKAEVPLAT